MAKAPLAVPRSDPLAGRPLVFIQHAKERMAERGISEDEVLDVVINFTVNRPGNTPNRARVEKMTNRGYLAVVIEPKIDKIEVVTAFRPRV